MVGRKREGGREGGEAASGLPFECDLALHWKIRIEPLKETMAVARALFGP